jgi:hypothetical protein
MTVPPFVGDAASLADDRYAAAFWNAYDPNAPVGTAASHPTILANPSQAVTPSTFEEARALQASTFVHQEEVNKRSKSLTALIQASANYVTGLR